MGKKRGRGYGSFIGDTRQHGIEFYRQVVQDLKPWRPPPPKWPEQSDEDQSDQAFIDSEGPERVEGESDASASLERASDASLVARLGQGQGRADSP
jgi:hypothetical protein